MRLAFKLSAAILLPALFLAGAQAILLEQLAGNTAQAISNLYLMQVVAATMFLVVSFFLHNSIIRPLEELNREIEAVSLGDLEAPIGNTERADEIGSIARAFKRTIVSLKVSMKGTEKHSSDHGYVTETDIARFIQDQTRNRL